MTAIIIPRRHLAQPQGRVQVRREYAGRVVSLLHFGGGGGGVRDIADGGRAYGLTGTAEISPSTTGQALKTSGTTGYAEASGVMPGVSGAFTLVMYFNEFGAIQDANGGMLYAIPAASQYTQLTSTGGIFFAGQGPYGLPSDPRGTRNTTIALRGAAGDPAFFVGRGKAVGVTASLPSGAKTVRVGAWSSNGWQFNGQYGSVAVVSGALSDQEIFDLVDYPWMLYEADPLRIYSLPSGLITLNSLTMSAITQTTARATLGLIR